MFSKTWRPDDAYKELETHLSAFISMTLSKVTAWFSNMRNGKIEKVPRSVASLIYLKLRVSMYFLENYFCAHLGQRSRHGRSKWWSVH